MSFMTYMLVKCIKKKIAERERREGLSHDGASDASEITELPCPYIVRRNAIEEIAGLDSAFFNFDMVAAATNNFSYLNKLGEGGFGPVYKGRLADGREIAVKRLSQLSAQGTEEFKNEVELISRLQHNNLVRLLGCCVHSQEKLLLYEFMPNSSLDSFLFDVNKGGILDWNKRYHIIEGIAWGLLYLHRDSRLKIIHRDLKASNVLLDGEFNPKISDFGIARIFSEGQIQETKRVVGTIGYMSPEYAVEGQISEKSDVFSFGVLLLEIVSGKRNNYFIDDDHALNLLGYAWMLWKESRATELADPSLGDSYPQKEMLKCIKIGLLCVQEYAIDRPTMSLVVSMLNSETILPSPKPVAFFGGARRETSSIYNTTTVSSMDSPLVDPTLST